jgi:hypothetical protein
MPLRSAIERLNAAIGGLREAQLVAVNLWRSIDTPDSASLIAKRVPWRIMEEMDRRMHAVSIAVAHAEAAALDIEAKQS